MSKSTPSVSELMSLPRAAELSGCPYSTLYLHGKSDRLKIQEIEGRIYTTMADLREYLADRALEGRLGGGR